MKTEFQYYKGIITADRPEGFVTLERMLNSISNPKPELKLLLDDIKQAAAAGNDKHKTELKTKLYSFTPCAIVSNWRNYANIQKFTGLAVLDFDKISFAKKLKTYLFNSYPCMIAVWISPSGKGVKTIFKIPVVQSVDEFKGYFFGMSAELARIAGFDIINQNPVQKLFIGEDPEILIRSNAIEWDIKGIKIDSFKYSNQVTTTITPTSGHTNWIVNWFTKNINSITNNGHPQVRDTSITMGGYISGGYIKQHEAEALAANLIRNNQYLSKGTDGYIETATWGLNEGMKSPLTWDTGNRKPVVHSVVSPVSKKIQSQSFEPVDILPAPRTLDDVFKYFYNKGCKSLPKGIQINSDNWKGNIT